MTDDVNYKLGCMASSLKAIEVNMAEIKDTFKAQETRLRSLEETRARQYGVLAGVGTVCGIIGSIVAKVVLR